MDATVALGILNIATTALWNAFNKPEAANWFGVVLFLGGIVIFTWGRTSKSRRASGIGLLTFLFGLTAIYYYSQNGNKLSAISPGEKPNKTDNAPVPQVQLADRAATKSVTPSGAKSVTIGKIQSDPPVFVSVSSKSGDDYAPAFVMVLRSKGYALTDDKTQALVAIQVSVDAPSTSEFTAFGEKTWHATITATLGANDSATSKRIFWSTFQGQGTALQARLATELDFPHFRRPSIESGGLDLEN